MYRQTKGWHETVLIGMRMPVKCRRCAKGVYDICDRVDNMKILNDGHSTWITPCCGATVDDYLTPALRCIKLKS